MTDHSGFDPTRLLERERVAFYGLLFAMSAADGSMDKEELELIYGAIDLGGLTPEARERVNGFVVSPPAVEELERSFQRIIRKHGYQPGGPKPGEDET